MKLNIYKALAIATALLCSVMTVYSQDSETGVRTAKSVLGPDDNGNYTITLETYATGATTVKPLDIVLVLDRSGSMNDPYKPTESRTWNATTIQNYGKTLYERVAASSDANYAYDYYELRVRNNRIERRNTLSDRWYNAGWSTYNGVLYTDIKLPALKEAVNAFIKKIDDKDKLGGSKRIGNRISIVIFSGSQTWSGTPTGNAQQLAGWTYLGDSGLDINVQTGYNTLTNSVSNITAEGSTLVDDAMTRANSLLSGARSNAVKTVVLFTDGIPGTGKWNSTATSVANSAISTANTIKGSDGSKATIWTVGLFEPMSDSEVAQTNTYMSRVSSNYLGVTNMTSSAQAVDTKYYIEVGDDDSLTDIFESVAEASATNLGATTQVRDQVSNSFVIPEGTEANDIKVFTSNVTGETTWGDEVPFNATISFLDKDGSVIDMDDEEDDRVPKSIVVEGFDFGKPDSSVGAGDGNWVGQRYNTSSGYFWAGKKLVIRFNIKANGEATGGVGTPTNDPSSGVYKKNEDDSYTLVTPYDQPHTTLTVNLKIMKSGLRSGESATFEIHKVRPKNWDENKDLQTNINAMEYNVIGKPVPGDNWDTHFSKVIITNKTEVDGAEITKILYALDPYWVYRVVEDDWGWAYEMTGHTETSTGERVATTSDVELNPFTFTNTEKTGVPKHAEAVTINHFGYTIQTGEFEGKQEEHYKSSKVESF